MGIQLDFLNVVTKKDHIENILVIHKQLYLLDSHLAKIIICAK